MIKTTALFLAALLSSPDPGFALRNQEVAEAPPVLNDLKSQLTSSDRQTITNRLLPAFSAGLEEFGYLDYGALLDQAPGIRRMSAQEQMRMSSQSYLTAGNRWISQDGLVEIIQLGEGVVIRLNDYAGGSTLNIQEGYLPEPPGQRALFVESLHSSGTNLLFGWQDDDKHMPLIQRIEYRVDGDSRILTLAVDPRMDNIPVGQPIDFPYPTYPIVSTAPFEPKTVVIRLQRESGAESAAEIAAAADVKTESAVEKLTGRFIEAVNLLLADPPVSVVTEETLHRLRARVREAQTVEQRMANSETLWTFARPAAEELFQKRIAAGSVAPEKRPRGEREQAVVVPVLAAAVDIPLPFRREHDHLVINTDALNISAAGPAMNVLRAFSGLGAPVRAVGVYGSGARGRMLSELAKQAGIPFHPDDWLAIERDTSANFFVMIDEGQAGISFEERIIQPPAAFNDREMEEYLRRLKAVLATEKGGIFVLSSRAPSNAPISLLSQLVRMANEEGFFTIYDPKPDLMRNSDFLKTMLEARMGLFKPNLEEFSIAIGKEQEQSHLRQNPLQIVEEARKLMADHGIRMMLISMDKDGALLIDPKRVAYAKAPAITLVSSVGAGDLALAAMVDWAVRQGYAFGDLSDAAMQELVQVFVAAGSETSHLAGSDVATAFGVDAMRGQVNSSLFYDSNIGNLPAVMSAGLEEVIIPSPYSPDTPPASDLWQDAWGVFPSVAERFHRMAVMAAPGGPTQFLRVFASLRVGDLPRPIYEEMFDGRRLIDHLPKEGLDSGHIRARGVHPYVGWRIGRILENQGLTVRARIHLTPGDPSGDVAIPMRPINVWPDGAIRFEGLVPAEPQFEGDSRFTVEILWKGKWHRVREDGWIRIDPPNPAQIAAQATEGELLIGQQDALDELRFARGIAQEVENNLPENESEKNEAIEAIKLVREKGVVTDPVLPVGHRAPLLHRLVAEGKMTPAQARRAFVAQQQAAGLQKGFFVGMQFRLGVLPGGRRILIMFNPNRANTPKPPPLKEGEKAGHPLGDTKPLKLVIEGEVQVVPQRSLPGFSAALQNPLKAKINPYGYVYGHSTLPTVQQHPQAGWKEAIRATVTEMWEQAERQTVIAGNVGAKAAASLPDWAHLHDVPWRMPLDTPQDEEIAWKLNKNGTGVGILKDPDMAVFVLEGGGNPAERETMIEQAQEVVAWLQEQGLGEYNLWGAVADGVGYLLIVPRNLTEPVPPADPVLKAKWKPSDDYAKPIAAEDYWVVDLGDGQYRLMSWSELESFGLTKEFDPVSGYKQPYQPDKPFIPAGRPVLDIKEGNMELRGFYLVAHLNIYEDPYLEARLEKANQLHGIPVDDPRIQKVIQHLEERAKEKADDSQDQQAAKEVRAALDLIRAIQTPQQLIDLFARMSRWRDREVRAFEALSPQQRDEMTRRLEELIRTLAVQAPPQGQQASIVVVSSTTEADHKIEKMLPAVVGMSVNGTLDLTVEVIERDDKTQALRVTRSAGGYPAHIVRGMGALGVTNHLVTVAGGQTGKTMVEELRQAKGASVAGINGPQTRVSILIARPSGPEIRLVGPGSEAVTGDLVDAAREAAIQELKTQAQRRDKPVFVAGERYSGEAEVEALVAAIEEAKEAKCVACIQANSAWNDATWDRVLRTSPQIFVSPLNAIARYLNLDPDRMRYHPELLARQVDRLRRAHNVEEWLVPFRDGSVVLVTREGMWHVLHSPLLRLTYTTGTTDVVVSSYLRARMARMEPVEAARLGMTAGAIYMERQEKERGRLPVMSEVEGERHRTLVNVLPRFLPAGAAREFHAFVDNSRRDFERFHRIGLGRLQESSEYDMSMSSIYMGQMNPLGALIYRLLPDVLNHVVDGRFDLAFVRTQEALFHVEVQQQNISLRTQGSLTPQNVEQFLTIPQGEGQAYLEWIASLTTALQGWLAQFQQMAGPGFQPPPSPSSAGYFGPPAGVGTVSNAGEPAVTDAAKPPAGKSAVEPFTSTMPEELPKAPIPSHRVKGTFTVLAQPPAESGKNPPAPSAGLEGQGIWSAWRAMEEARTGRGVLVIPAQTFRIFTGLESFLKVLPGSFAADVVLWGDSPEITRLQRANPALKAFRQEDPVELAVFLAGLTDAERVGILGDSSAAQRLAPLMARFRIAVTVVRWDVPEILVLLGTPREVLDQLNLEKLFGDLFTKTRA
ncbi:MAG: PfkB family carbohydrate kinase [Candidatus Omnitrophica bacterium]|nr:PfkB family carbohydrate kinase [Candidatus Omnitrophota bacterium]